MANPEKRSGPAKLRGEKMREMIERAENAAPGVSEPKAEKVMRNAEKYAPGVRNYRKGGCIDGIAKKGKTRGRVI